MSQSVFPLALDEEERATLTFFERPEIDRFEDLLPPARKARFSRATVVSTAVAILGAIMLLSTLIDTSGH